MTLQSCLTHTTFTENEEGEIDTFVEADDSNIIGDDTDYQEIYYYIVGMFRTSIPSINHKRMRTDI